MISRIDLKIFWNLFKSGGNIAKTLRPIVASSLYDWIKGERTGITYQEIDSLLSVIDDAAVALINNSSLLATAMYNDNASRLFAVPHFPKTTFAWIMASPEMIARKTTYTRVIYNCPVDIKVYDSSNCLVAAIVNNVPQDIPNSTISSYVDVNEQKIFCLPDDENYRFEITGTDIGTMTCSYEDYDFSLGRETKVENYNNIPVDRGTKITATIKTKKFFKEQLEVSLLKDGKIINASENVDPERDTHIVTVNSNVETGVVLGGGTFIKGKFCKVTAFESDKNSFIGWYINGKLVSSELEYRFLVENDVTIVGCFEEKKLLQKSSLFQLVIRKSNTKNQFCWFHK